jgi:hypothetical protein
MAWKIAEGGIMLAKEAVTHIVSFLPESMSFEEIIQALSLIYNDRRGIDECPDTQAPAKKTPAKKNRVQRTVSAL